MQLHCKLLQHVNKALLPRYAAAAHTPSSVQAYAAGAAATATAQWLGVHQPGNQLESSAAGLFSSIIDQADRLLQEQQVHTSTGGAAAPAWRAKTVPVSAAAPCGIILKQQQLNLPVSFTVPTQTSVAVHQFVAVFSSMLDCPVMVHKECRINSMEAKWRLLQLLLLHGCGDLDGFYDGLQLLLEDSLRIALHKIHKVRADPKIPATNKQLAEQHFHTVWTSCHDAICEWVEATCNGPTFATLQPALAELAPLLNTSVLTLAEELQQPTHSNESGKLMEAAAVQAVREALPPGWSLLTSLHLLGVDGQVLTTMPRCKFEADMLVLDQSGVAVAIIEVKLAAANPLMALVNDAAGLLQLVDKTAGKYLTCITRGAATAATAAAAAAAGGGGGSSSSPTAPRPCAELHQRLAAMVNRPPFAEGPGWHVLHVPVHAELLPVYVLGNGISEASMNRGLNSLVSSSTLRMLSKSPAALVAAMQQSLRAQPTLSADVQQQATATGGSSSSSTTSTGSSFMEQLSSSSSSSSSSCSECEDFDHLSSSSSSSSLEDEAGMAAATAPAAAAGASADAPQLPGCGADGPQLAAAVQGRPESLNSARARIRAQLHLTAEQQQWLERHITRRLVTLQERCRIFSLYKQG